MRGDPQSAEATVVVVRADGSDERVVVPEDRVHRGFGVVAWTPNGTSLVVQVDSPPFLTPATDGKLSLFDALGEREERVLTPPAHTDGRRPLLQHQ
ncbi:MAG TPA: hypothetical protein VFY46_05970 [Acidimicrobiia bacterium]|nr:hypothetical protein [Acidimicrobiia bacterium]